jgi:MFS family permease
MARNKSLYGGNMKLNIVKIISQLMTVIGVLAIFVFTFSGDILYGWIIFIIMMLLSGIISLIFYRCPKCKKALPVNGSSNQKYCPVCGENLGMKPAPFGYYGKCKRDKAGAYVAYTIVGQITFLVTTFIMLLVVVTIFGMNSIFAGTGRIMTILSFAAGILLGLFCRCIVGFSAKLDEENLYYSAVPFIWKKYELEELRQIAKHVAPFYHPIRGLVLGTKSGALCIQLSSCKGGEEFLNALSQKLEITPVEVEPDKVVSKLSEEGKRAEEEYKDFINRLKKEEGQ